MSNLAEADEVTRTAEEDKIIEWRVQELEKAGYNKLHAERIGERALAGNPDYIDLHAAVLLVTPIEKGGKGCPHTIAADILL